MYREILDKIKKDNAYVSLYTDRENTSKFTFGQIINFDETFFALKMFSPNGEDDGIALKRIDGIYRLKTKGKYTEKMKKLIAIHGDKLRDNCVLENKGLVNSLLLHAKKYNQIVSVEILNSEILDPIGFVLDIHNGICKIQQVDEYGCEDGISYINIPDITEIYCDTEDEKILYEAWKNNCIGTE